MPVKVLTVVPVPEAPNETRLLPSYSGAGMTSEAMLLFSPSAVSRLRGWSLIKESFNLMRGVYRIGLSDLALLHPVVPQRENTSAFPVRPTVVRRMSAAELGLLVPLTTAPAGCFLRVSNQAGDKKMWTIVTLLKSIRAGERVGSWVAMTTRVA